MFSQYGAQCSEGRDFLEPQQFVRADRAPRGGEYVSMNRERMDCMQGLMDSLFFCAVTLSCRVQHNAGLDDLRRHSSDRPREVGASAGPR